MPIISFPPRNIESHNILNISKLFSILLFYRKRTMKDDFEVDGLNNFCQVWTAIIVQCHYHVLYLSGEKACCQMQRALFSN